MSNTIIAIVTIVQLCMELTKLKGKKIVVEKFYEERESLIGTFDRQIYSSFHNNILQKINIFIQCFFWVICKHIKKSKRYLQTKMDHSANFSPISKSIQFINKILYKQVTLKLNKHKKRDVTLT
ncbi:hypothetical protein RFI_34787 [Reticulomyxa filosa]|uniref:Uncharacterized protein n=1 Tax=Reticulomyxa filosa TaxID=46433 RepID=X6LML8_RETFI|nr:hypothetical protein RFI_34787 [Reticulomyxa filosa]|eukprot:ETO02631.1 hypothetical protein RFI_34787 [Reticulomyxa filosa]